MMALVGAIVMLIGSCLLVYLAYRYRRFLRGYRNRHNEWQRQRWSMRVYNGRRSIDFGYFLHRSSNR